MLAHVGEHELLEVDLVYSPGRVDDRPVDACQHGRLPIGVALADDRGDTAAPRDASARANKSCSAATIRA